MADQKNTFPAGSILASMKLDIYASTEHGEVSVFYDAPFGKELVSLEYEPKARTLDFLFMDETKSLGATISADLSPYLEKSNNVNFFELDSATRKAKNAYDVPLKIAAPKQNNPKPAELSNELTGSFTRNVAKDE